MHTHTHTLKHLPRRCRALGITRTPRLFRTMVSREASCGRRENAFLLLVVSGSPWYLWLIDTPLPISASIFTWFSFLCISAHPNFPLLIRMVSHYTRADLNPVTLVLICWVTGPLH